MPNKVSFAECPYCHKRSWVTDGETKKVPHIRSDGRTVHLRISYGCALQCMLGEKT